MKITNKFGMPPEMVRTAHARLYDKGEADISVTSLLAPPRINLMLEQHKDVVAEDVRDLVYSMLGTSFHNLMQEAAEYEQGVISEERIHLEVTGVKVSGQIDRQVIHRGGVSITDYKVTSVNAYRAKMVAMKQNVRKGLQDQIDWVQQVNLYAYLVRKARGLPVHDAEVIVLLRDWSKMRAENDPSYPASPAVSVGIPLYKEQLQYKFLLGKVAQYKRTKNDLAVMDRLPLCTDEEVWAKPDQWAVMREGGSRALTIETTRKAAETALATTSGGHRYLEKRPGQRTRCEYYCPVSSVCQQYADWKTENEEINKTLKVIAKINEKTGK